uniref:glutathione S-transferase PARB-like n=1 Tax=Erigeron canadensis TaxID=72917 RepID=UPI001CB9A3A2|nr:glutathione S-transferase PARB-like [Erigeron canadensis]
MAIKFYGTIGSTSAFRALVGLVEKDIEFEFVPVSTATKEHKSPNFLALHPFGQVPAFQDGDLTLFESRAITKYIEEAYPNKGTSLISKDVKKRAIQTVWGEVEALRYEPTSIKLVWELAVKPKRGLIIDEAIVKESESKLTEILDVYEARLKESKYLGGESFSLVDLHHLPNTHYLMGTKVKRLFDERPHVSAWASDILSRPAWVKVTSMSNK